MSERVNSSAKSIHASLAQALESLHACIAEAVLLLGPEAFDWLPAPGLPTVRELVVGVAAEERHWIADCVLPDLVEETCLPEDEPLSTDHPLYALGCAGQISQTILATLSPGQWTKMRRADGAEISVADCVLRCLEALAHAFGQLEFLAVLWSVREQE